MSNEDEKVLTQADVDALVALVPDAPRAAAPPVSANLAPVEQTHPAAADAVRTSTPAYQPPPPRTIPSSEIIALQKTVADLTRQVSKLADTAQRLDSREERTSQLAQVIQRSAHDDQPSAEIIAEIQARLRDLSRHLNHRNELREEFECEHCKSQGNVAFLTKCTSCGQERWFGWWPSKKASENESRRKVVTGNNIQRGNR